MGCHVARRLGVSSCAAMFVSGIVGGFLLAAVLVQNGELAASFRGAPAPVVPAALPAALPSALPQRTPPAQRTVPAAELDADAEEDADTYEPHLVKDPPKPDPAEALESVSRPRFYSTELGTHRKLYVAVLTSPETVHTQARSINHTLAHITANIGFFMAGDAGAPLPKNLHNVVIFSPEEMGLPLKTAEYLAEHFGDMYDFFFVVRDSSFVRGYRLQELVEDLSISGDVLLGGAECRLEDGLLLSRKLLTSVVGRAAQCHEQHSSAAGPDAALVSCLEQGTGTTCSSQTQGKQYISRRFSEYNPSTAGDISGLITVRDVLRPADAGRLHAAFSRLEIEQIDAKIGQLRQALQDNQRNMQALARAKAASSGDKSMAALPEELPWPAGSSAPVRTTSRHHINTWERFSATQLYLVNPESVSDPLTHSDLLDVQDVIELGMEEVRRSGDYKLHELKAGYRRFDGGRGMDYILELEVELAEGGLLERRRVEVHRPILQAELVPMPFVTEKPTVTVVLPVTVDKVKQAEQFVQNVVNSSENLSVVLYLIAGDSSLEVFRPLVQMVQASNKRPAAPGRRMGWLTLIGHERPSQFFIMDAVVKKVQGKQLILLLSEPGVEYNSEMFNRARMQTIRGWEVFCPIPWVEYHPDLIYNHGKRGDKLEIHKNYGQFDGDFYGALSFYTSDYVDMRNRTLAEIPPMEQSSIPLDRNHQHPYDLFGAFVRHSGLHVHRAVDPNFRLLYFPRHCPANPELFYQKSCVKSMLYGIGSQQQLSEALEAFKEAELKKQKLQEMQEQQQQEREQEQELHANAAAY